MSNGERARQRRREHKHEIRSQRRAIHLLEHELRFHDDETVMELLQQEDSSAGRGPGDLEQRATG